MNLPPNCSRLLCHSFSNWEANVIFQLFWAFDFFLLCGLNNVRFEVKWRVWLIVKKKPCVKICQSQWSKSDVMYQSARICFFVNENPCWLQHLLFYPTLASCIFTSWIPHQVHIIVEASPHATLQLAKCVRKLVGSLEIMFPFQKYLSLFCMLD